MTDLLTLQEAAERIGLKSAEGFARLARRAGIPLIRLSARTVRVDARDLEAFLRTQRRVAPKQPQRQGEP